MTPLRPAADLGPSRFRPRALSAPLLLPAVIFLSSIIGLGKLGADAIKAGWSVDAAWGTKSLFFFLGLLYALHKMLLMVTQRVGPTGASVLGLFGRRTIRWKDVRALNRDISRTGLTLYLYAPHAKLQLWPECFDAPSVVDQYVRERCQSAYEL